MNSHFETIRRCVEEERPVVAATVIEGGDQVGARLLVFEDGSTEGTLGDPRLEGEVRDQALAALRRGKAQRGEITAGDQPLTLFYDV